MGRRQQIIMRRALRSLLPGRMFLVQIGCTVKIYGVFLVKKTMDVWAFGKTLIADSIGDA